MTNATYDPWAFLSDTSHSGFPEHWPPTKPVTRTSGWQHAYNLGDNPFPGFVKVAIYWGGHQRSGAIWWGRISERFPGRE